MADEIRMEQVGFDFIVIFKTPSGSIIDISTATTKSITFRKPSGSPMTKTASFVTDGHDGQIHWMTTSSTDLSEKGAWILQGKVVLSGGATYRTSLNFFQVAENLVEV